MSGQWTRFVAPHRHPSIGDLLLLFCLHSAWVCCPILAILVSHLRLRVCVWMDGKNISVDRHLQSVLAEPVEVEIDRGRASEVYPERNQYTFATHSHSAGSTYISKLAFFYARVVVG